MPFKIGYNEQTEDHKDPIYFRDVHLLNNVVWYVHNLHTWETSQRYRLLYNGKCSRDDSLACYHHCQYHHHKYRPIQHGQTETGSIGPSLGQHCLFIGALHWFDCMFQTQIAQLRSCIFPKVCLWWLFCWLTMHALWIVWHQMVATDTLKKSFSVPYILSASQCSMGRT